MDRTQSLLVMNMLPTVGSRKARLLIQHFGSPENVLDAKESQILRVNGIGEKTASIIASWRDTVSIDEELEKVARAKAHLVTFMDDDYPANLVEIYDAPLILYVKGTLEGQDKYSVAIVGSRRASNYGRETASKLAGQLSRSWFTVVSGLAHGIDMAAHRGALQAGGRTLAVIGSGLNNPYPPEAAEMFDEIAEQGAVISEFPMDARPDKINFPIRNRVISGLSLGVVIVEAPARSGALITADHALSQNRLVFAVPGRIDAPTFKGNHSLLKQGAKLVESAQDIIEEFDYLFPKKDVLKGKYEPEPGSAPALEEIELKVYAVIDQEGKHIDEVIQESELRPTEVSAILLQLEMKRLVKQLPGKVFVRSSLYQI